MNILFFVASIGFFIWIARSILFWVALWQLKEYRFDRVFVHLRETQQGKDLLFSKSSNLKWIAIIVYIAVLANDVPPLPYQILIAAIFSFCAFLALKEVYFRLLKRPVFTFKALVILLLSLFSLVLLFKIPLIDKFVWLLLLDRLTPFLIGFFVFLFSFPTELYRDFKIERAIKKMRLQKNLLVIGVTGSYGKSSTKEYLAQILEKNFKVIKTRGTNNTPIGIANIILSDLKKSTEIFVVEMGAYKKGEIAQMCQIVHPKIGVLAGINDQHLSLFGSLKSTIEAKYELIESLPKNGLALFNGNNVHTQKLYQKTKKAKVLYSSIPRERKAEISASNIRVKKASLLFDILLKGMAINFETPLIGAQNIENILPGIYIAHHLGMTTQEIQKAVSTLSPLPKTMAFRKAVNGATLIDDSFNANPDAVLAALAYMKIYKGKKFLVLQPMIELGKNAGSQHYQIAKEISSTCDYLFLTNKNFYKEIERGIVDGGGKCRLALGNSSKVSAKILSIIAKGDVVVFEGKEAGLVLDRIKE